MRVTWEEIHPLQRERERERYNGRHMELDGNPNLLSGRLGIHNWGSRKGKFHYSIGSLSFFFFFLIIKNRAGLLVTVIWSVCISKSQRIVLHQGRILLPAWSNLKMLVNSLWITFCTLPYLVLYNFGASLLHSLIMRSIVSFLFSKHLHLLFFRLIYFYFNIIGPCGFVICWYYFLSQGFPLVAMS